MLDNDTIRKRIGTRIAEARGTRTRREVARALNVSVQALSQWERGDTSPTPAMQLAVAEVLEVSWSSLFALDGEVA